VPRLARWFVKASLLYLLAGFTIGAAILIQAGGGPWPVVWRLRPAHIELLVVGWAVQLAMGVAFWASPRFRRPRPRGDVRVAAFAFVVLNTGVLLAAVAQTLLWPPTLLLLGRGAVLVAVVAFAVHLWPRIKPVGA